MNKGRLGSKRFIGMLRACRHENPNTLDRQERSIEKTNRQSAKLLCQEQLADYELETIMGTTGFDGVKS